MRVTSEAEAWVVSPVKANTPDAGNVSEQMQRAAASALGTLIKPAVTALIVETSISGLSHGKDDVRLPPLRSARRALEDETDSVTATDDDENGGGDGGDEGGGSGGSGNKSGQGGAKGEGGGAAQESTCPSTPVSSV
uniref:Uncharacterized protein n=1 Tax=Haptolina ericina TaxID=156174 RepID=A0A7S3BQ50_9EUKA|mmetsp:Transcript_63380/g.141301  ORF Transcript_63380/g.141301 Transcript_63380/m.141301 type:complete len:137 (+) Transcript_63380:118-528(+)